MSSGGSSGVSNGTAGAQGSLEQMNAELAAIANEEKLSNNGLISNKFSDKQRGKEYGFIRSNGRIFTKNGINRVNFVIDKNGQLHLGNGHSYLARGESVKAAGTMKIGSDGVPRRITNLSGHYQPNVKETVHYLETMHKNGYISNRTWVDIYSFEKNKSGYITKAKAVYSGPYLYLNRRFSK